VSQTNPRRQTRRPKTVPDQINAVGVTALARGDTDGLLARQLSELTGASLELATRLLERYCRDEHGRQRPTPLSHHIRIVMAYHRDLINAMSESFGYPARHDAEGVGSPDEQRRFDPGEWGEAIPLRKRTQINAVGRECIVVYTRMRPEMRAVARKLGQAVDGHPDQEWTDVLLEYMDATDGEGHPHGLAAWLVEQVREHHLN
jgi:hypothetical protein